MPGRPLVPFDAERLRQRLLDGGVFRDGCLEWTRYINPRNGYGQVSLNQIERFTLELPRVVTVPRLMCTLDHGPAPLGCVVLHSCDNKPCFDPAHLRWGTQAENNREAWERARQIKGEGHHQAKVSDEMVREVIRRARAGESVYDLAAEHGMEWSTVYRWLRGEGRGQVA